MHNKYGYKVCYRQYNKTKLKIYLVCNTYSGAEWSIRYYTSHDTYDRKTNKLLQNIEWYILPVKTLIEYKWLWKGCPFR